MTLNTESIYQDFASELLRFLQRRVTDSDAAEDLLQEIFIRVHNRIDTLRDEDRLQSWLYQIARNTIVDYYRGIKETSELPETLASPSVDSGGNISEELAGSIRNFLLCLPVKYRKPLILTEYRGFTQQEIARRLGLSLSGAKTRVQRAREKLKELLLNCCQFELDRLGNIIDYYPRQNCCTADSLRVKC